MQKPQKQLDTNQKFVPKSKYDELEFKYQKLLYEVKDLRRMIFGSKTERFVTSDQQEPIQTGLFAPENPPESESKEESAKEVITYLRKKKDKKQPKREKISDLIPRVKEIIEPNIDFANSEKLGEKITEVLEYKPGKLFARQIVRPQYKVKEKIVIADLPSLPLPKSNAGASLLAHILVSKFIDHLPLYRQIQQFKRQNLFLSNSTVNNWTNKSIELLTPLYELLKKQTLATDYIQVDESPIEVQDEKKKDKLHKGYMWVFRNPLNNLVFFDYNPSRKGEVAETILDEFLGALQTDAYKGYLKLASKENITSLACMAHVRRKFEKAKENDLERAEYALLKFQELYAIERNAKEESPDKRYELRQKFAKPILEEFITWLKNNKASVTPKSTIGKAIDYAINLGQSLNNYLLDGRYEIDNNKIENTIRPLALGRKNYLFAGSHDAAKNIAMMYSFFATCKINDTNPLEWLTYVFNNILDCKTSQLHTLLPNNWNK